MSCIVANCVNNKRRSDRSISFHRLPTQPVRKQQWISALRLFNFEVHARTLVCSKHFKEEDFIEHVTERGKRRLFPSSVPYLDKVENEYRSDDSIAVRLRQLHEYVNESDYDTNPDQCSAEKQTDNEYEDEDEYEYENEEKSNNSLSERLQETTDYEQAESELASNSDCLSNINEYLYETDRDSTPERSTLQNELLYESDNSHADLIADERTTVNEYQQQSNDSLPEQLRNISEYENTSDDSAVSEHSLHLKASDNENDYEPVPKRVRNIEECEQEIAVDPIPIQLIKLFESSPLAIKTFKESENSLSIADKSIVINGMGAVGKPAPAYRKKVHKNNMDAYYKTSPGSQKTLAVSSTVKTEMDLSNSQSTATGRNALTTGVNTTHSPTTLSWKSVIKSEVDESHNYVTKPLKSKEKIDINTSNDLSSLLERITAKRGIGITDECRENAQKSLSATYRLASGMKLTVKSAMDTSDDPSMLSKKSIVIHKKLAVLRETIKKKDLKIKTLNQKLRRQGSRMKKITELIRTIKRQGFIDLETSEILYSIANMITEK